MRKREKMRTLRFRQAQDFGKIVQEACGNANGLGLFESRIPGEADASRSGNLRATKTGGPAPLALLKAKIDRRNPRAPKLEKLRELLPSFLIRHSLSPCLSPVAIA